MALAQHNWPKDDSVDRLNVAERPTLRRRLAGHVRFTGFGLCVLALGLLIWARLMLVTSHPRTAIAEPQPEPAIQVVGAEGASPDPMRD